jgi:hypothetical protein
LLHGLQDDEREILSQNIADALNDTCHPMLLPVILCEMLSDADSMGIRLHGLELSKVEFRANFSGFYQLIATPNVKFNSSLSGSETIFANTISGLWLWQNSRGRFRGNDTNAELHHLSFSIP